MPNQDETETQVSPKTRFIPLSDWGKFHPWPPLGGLRHLVFNEKTNGFNAVVKRSGRRVLIDEAAFFTWMEEQNSEGAGQ